jgi:hypothetical protein
VPQRAPVYRVRFAALPALNRPGTESQNVAHVCLESPGQGRLADQTDRCLALFRAPSFGLALEQRAVVFLQHQ